MLSSVLVWAAACGARVPKDLGIKVLHGVTPFSCGCYYHTKRVESSRFQLLKRILFVLEIHPVLDP